MNWVKRINSKYIKCLAIGAFIILNIISFQNCAPSGALKAASSTLETSSSNNNLLINENPVWSGSGVTTTILAGGDIQAAINAANDGDTIELANGTWVGLHLSINKKIRLKSASKWKAVLQGFDVPTESTGSAVSISDIKASGAFIQDISFKWYGENALSVKSVKDVVIIGNRIESNGGQAIKLFDTVDVNIISNVILDPYLAAHLTTAIDDTSNTNWLYNNDHVLMDYGVAVYGSLRTIVQKNYFHGQFNQTISFKEGNRDYIVANNTFEGFSGAALIMGQNVAKWGPYNTAGLPNENDSGNIKVYNNTLRPIVGTQGVNLAEYRGNNGFCLGHLSSANVEMTNNHIEGAFVPLLLAMGANSTPGGPSGNLYLKNNFYNGKLYDDGTNVATTAKNRSISNTAIVIHSGVEMNVFADQESFANITTPITNNGIVGSVQTTNFQIIPSQKILLQKVSIPTN